MIIVNRPKELETIAGVRKWTLIYGRRKTGKTFLVERFVKYDDYFFVNRDRTILSKISNLRMTYDMLVELLRRDLADGKTVVIDEFQRLGEPFLDLLHSMKKSGRLILLTSTLFFAKNLLHSRSPLLGLFHEAQIGLMRLDDCLLALNGRISSKQQLLESAVMIREPITVDYFEEKEDVRKTFVKILRGLANTVPALVGEIFLEEDRGLSATYEGIIRAVANGRVVSSEVASALFASRLIPKDDPSSIQPYLENLVRIGILRKLPLYGRKKRFVYKVASPLVRLFFYADEKYGIADRSFEDAEAERIIDALLPHIIEDELREYLANKLGLQENLLDDGDYELDGILTRFNKPALLLEVKWGKVNQAEVDATEDKLNRIEAARRILFVQDKKGLKSKALEIIDVGDLSRL
ncbi:AAA domain protein [uncultured archaeon]|nr:AAA domain protein [uncultured archaeon]